jgi:excisionase family DNA binding protein
MAKGGATGARGAAEPAVDEAARSTRGDDWPPILDTALAAELLSVHPEYLRRMVREDRIPAHRFPGGREIRFLRDELIAWVAAQPGHDRSPSAVRDGDDGPER